MERYRQVKMLSIIALVIAIVGMSLGFAAFSTTLSISSSASVNPSRDNFKVVFSNSSTSILGEGETAVLKGSDGGGKAENGIISSSKVSGLKGNFTRKGDMVDYWFYVHNVGEYDAYLTAVNMEVVDGTGVTKVCRASTTDETKATDSLVQAACGDINLYIMIGDYEYTVGDTNIMGHKLEKGAVQEVMIVMDYGGLSPLVDGPFDVTFGDLSLEFSTVDNSANLISFTIDVTEYHAEEGMTWEEWVNSSYNTDGFELSNNVIVASDKDYYIFYSDYFTYVDKNSIISSTEKYCTLMTPL